MYPIIPVNIPIVGQVDTLTVDTLPIAMKPGKSYSIQTYVTLRGPEAFYEKNVTIPAEVVSEWVDDQVIVDYVVSHLGIELAPVEEAPAEQPTEETPTEETPTEPAE